MSTLCGMVEPDIQKEACDTWIFLIYDWRTLRCKQRHIYMLIILVFVFYLPSLFHQNCIVFHTCIENTENAIIGLKMMNEDWISDYYVKLIVNHTQLGAFWEYIIPEDKNWLDLEIWIRDVISSPVTCVDYVAFTCSGNVSIKADNHRWIGGVLGSSWQ